MENKTNHNIEFFAPIHCRIAIIESDSGNIPEIWQINLVSADTQLVLVSYNFSLKGNASRLSPQNILFYLNDLDDAFKQFFLSKIPRTLANLHVLVSAVLTNHPNLHASYQLEIINISTPSLESWIKFFNID